MEEMKCSIKILTKGQSDMATFIYSNKPSSKAFGINIVLSTEVQIQTDIQLHPVILEQVSVDQTPVLILHVSAGNSDESENKGEITYYSNENEGENLKIEARIRKQHPQLLSLQNPSVSQRFLV